MSTTSDRPYCPPDSLQGFEHKGLRRQALQQRVGLLAILVVLLHSPQPHCKPDRCAYAHYMSASTALRMLTMVMAAAVPVGVLTTGCKPACSCRICTCRRSASCAASSSASISASAALTLSTVFLPAAAPASVLCPGLGCAGPSCHEIILYQFKLMQECSVKTAQHGGVKGPINSLPYCMSAQLGCKALSMHGTCQQKEMTVGCLTL